MCNNELQRAVSSFYSLDNCIISVKSYNYVVSTFYIDIVINAHMGNKTQ